MAGRWGDLEYALGGWSGHGDGRTGRFVDGAREKWEKWKTNMKVLQPVMQYVKDKREISTKGSNIRGSRSIFSKVQGAAEEAGVVEDGVVDETDEARTAGKSGTVDEVGTVQD